MAATRVTVYFGTNRNPLASGKTIVGFGPDPGPVDGIAVRFGSAQVDVDLEANANVMVPDSLSVAPETLIGKQGFQPQLGSHTIFEALRQQMMGSQKPTLVFIHGFSNSFKDAIERAAWNSQFYGLDMNIFVFTWPSRGSVTGIPLPYADYHHDRQSARISGVAISRTIRLLQTFVDGLSVRDQCGQKLHLLCHSMGNYVLRQAVQALVNTAPSDLSDPDDRRSVSAMASIPATTPYASTLRSIFDQIILAAADEDDDTFSDPLKLKYLPRLGNAITVYHTQEDAILGTLSRYTKFNGPRLGVRGPENMSLISDKVRAIDVTAVIGRHREVDSDPGSHQYYRLAPAVRDDIRLVFLDAPAEGFTQRIPVMEARYRLSGN